MGYGKPLDGNGLALVKQYVKQWLLGKQDKLTGRPGQIAGFGQNGELMAQDAQTGEGIPSGCILIWSGAANNIPDGWALCDGTNGTPDLRGRFVLGKSDNHEIGSTGGSETVTLTTAQMPTHSHNYYKTNSINSNFNTTVFCTVTEGTTKTAIKTSTTGSSSPHQNMPPYYTLCYIMKL